MRYKDLLNSTNLKFGFESVFGLYCYIYQNFTLNICSIYNSKDF